MPKAFEQMENAFQKNPFIFNTWKCLYIFLMDHIVIWSVIFFSQDRKKKLKGGGGGKEHLGLD